MSLKRPLICSAGPAVCNLVFCRSESRKTLLSYRPLASTLTAPFHDFCAFSGFFPEEFLAIAPGQIDTSNAPIATSDPARELKFLIVFLLKNLQLHQPSLHGDQSESRRATRSFGYFRELSVFS